MNLSFIKSVLQTDVFTLQGQRNIYEHTPKIKAQKVTFIQWLLNCGAGIPLGGVEASEDLKIN